MHGQYLPLRRTSLGGRLAVWVATGLGLGMGTPAIPGTVGGLWGLALVPLIDKLPRFDVQLALIAAMLVAAAVVCAVAARAMGASGDPGAIVLDEIVVVPIVFLGGPQINAPLLAAGYVLFRIFDVWKPGLIRTLERLPGGVGIVADDVAAAFLAWVALRCVLWLDAASSAHWLT